MIDEALPGAGENDVKVRWNYHGVWAWWWEVDNAFITACEPIVPLRSPGQDRRHRARRLRDDRPDHPAAAGTTCTYCYEVTNTGDVTLNLHDLDDSQLGTIFNSFAYSLTPGALTRSC